MTETPDSSLFASPLHVINVGADLFADAIAAQGAQVTRVTWQPSPGNSDAALSVLLDDPRVDQANQEAAQRMIAARPRLVDVRPAGEWKYHLRTLPPPQRRWPNGWPHLSIHACPGHRRASLRAPDLQHLERGAGQGIALRRQQSRRHSKAALAGAGAGTGPGPGGGCHRWN